MPGFQENKEYTKETEEAKKFVELSRKRQITQVIEELSEEEFLQLQKSICQVFQEVSDLHRIVEDGLKKKQAIESILDNLYETYLESQEKSQYYKEQFTRIEHFFIAKIVTNAKMDGLIWEFIEQVEKPFIEFKDNIQRTIFTKNSMNQMIMPEDFREDLKIQILVELCSSIRTELESKIEGIPLENNIISTDLILPINHREHQKIAEEVIQQVEEKVKSFQEQKERMNEKKISSEEASELFGSTFDSKNWKTSIQKILDIIKKWYSEARIEVININMNDAFRIAQSPNKNIEEMKAMKSIPWFKRMSLADTVKYRMELARHIHEIVKQLNEQIESYIEDRKRQTKQELAPLLTAENILEEFMITEEADNDLEKLLESKTVAFSLEGMKNIVDLRKILLHFMQENIKDEQEKEEICQKVMNGDLDDSILEIERQIREKIPQGELQPYTILNMPFYSELKTLKGIREEDVIDAVLIKKLRK